MTHIRKWWDTHPSLFSWALLAVGMVIIVIIAARNVGFQPGQWAALLAATVALAGLCVWIIGWEDHDDEEARPSGARPSGARPSGAEPISAAPETAQPEQTTVERN